MLRQFFTTAAVLGLMTAGSAWAQSDTTQEPAATGEAASGETEAGSDSVLDFGTPVGQEATGEVPLGERYSKEKFGDWDLACLKTETDQDPCSLLQIMRDETGSPIAEFSLFRIENGGQARAGATLVVPLETLLTAQVTIAVDGGNAKRYNYSFCNPVGCVAQIGLTQADIDAFRRGNKAVITIVPAPAPDQRIDMDLSLTGFTAGYDVVDVVSQ